MRNRFFGAVLMAALISSAVAQQAAQRPATIAGHPNFNGIWQSLNTANWNLEAHPAQALDDFWGLGAIAAIPAGKQKPRQLAHRGPRSEVLHAGRSARHLP
jgi:opacity protein-like surface antigen